MPGPLPQRELVDALKALARAEVTLLLAISTDGVIGTWPPFQPSETYPDLPAFLRWLADVMEPNTSG
jgi:hypothetical protein